MDIEAKISALLDDPEFQTIDRRMARFNLFEAVGAIRAELRHSNFLGFLLSPSRSHGFGALPLRRTLRGVLAKMPDEQRPIRALELVVSDLDNAAVYREWHNIDLVIEIKQLHLIVVIENKIDARAGDGQLARYRQIIRGKYPDKKHLFVFLTPDGSDPDDSAYVPFSYAELAKVIEDLAEERSGNSSPDAGTIVRHYVEMLRRHIVPDEDLQDIARRIYERHKEALDFIFEARPQPESLLGIARSLLESQPGLIQDRHGTNILRFIPESWTAIPELNRCNAWTRSGRNVLFEIKTWNAGAYADRVIIALISGPAPDELRERIYAGAMARSDLFKGIVKPMGRQFATIYMRELLRPAIATHMDMEQKTAAIQDGWQSFTNEDLPRLTTAVPEIANPVTTSEPVAREREFERLA
jgi:hypothetical protein